MFSPKRFGQSGLTFVELLIVVIILAVLASVAIPQFSSPTDGAKSAALDATAPGWGKTRADSLNSFVRLQDGRLLHMPLTAFYPIPKLRELLLLRLRAP